ncbi:sulfite exporter TauE/SafE family protein [Hydrogenophaga sp.]|uniref:sulfite exporter TauE/SafE family protein n=1 Tax=Hydrogenophaga sp. TaxID=1904254 RepID=UPI00272F4E80|nr:sulfite exporter TauE/SafE family protein [Hydrogenophaga sp.]MDP1686650.1 sulfite exporter TauE/SafE family protein [Hydrogenophaga sp.]
MDAALIASAALLGLAGAPHCTAMCSAPCAAAIGRSGGVPATAAFHLARLASYAVAGAVVASTVGALAALAQLSPALRPLWTLVHALAFALGLWLLWHGRQPAWMAALGRPQAPAVAAGGWQAVRGPARAAVAGGLWVGWPCGLLQGALLVSSMTGSAVAGAAAMASFAVASSPGLLLAPWVWQRMSRHGDAAARERWAIRAAGGMLAAASGWVLTHGLWERFAAFCAQL